MKLLCLALSLAFLQARAPAQEVTPEVQQLYAEAQAAQAANQPGQAIADYQHILTLAPTLAPAYNNLGRLLYNAGRFPEAVTTLKRGLALNPAMPPAQVMLGAALLKLDRPAEAQPPLEAGVQAMPDDTFARMSLARTLLALNQLEPATAQLQALLRANPRDQQAWYLLGKLHLQLSQQSFAQVQAIDPAAPLAHILEGEIMESLSNTPGAITAYKQALTSAPTDPDALQHLADAYWHTGDWAHARPALTDLLTHEPGNCSAHWKLGNTLDELADSPADALTQLNTALMQCPTLAQAHAERARLLLRMNKPADALPDLKLAEAAAPDELSVQQLLAQTYRALGDPTRAAAANQRYLALQKAMHDAQEHHAATVIQANQ